MKEKKRVKRKKIKKANENKQVIYKFDPVKNVESVVFKDYGNVSFAPYIKYSHITEEFKYCIKVIDDDLYKNKTMNYQFDKNILYFVDLLNGIYHELLECTDKLVSEVYCIPNKPFAFVKSKEVAIKLVDEYQTYKDMKTYHYWRDEDNNFFTNVLATVYSVFDRRKEVVKYKYLEEVLEHYDVIEKKAMRAIIVSRKKSREKMLAAKRENEKQAYIKKRREFNVLNDSKKKILEMRTAPVMDDVTVLIPKEKKRFSK